MLTTCARPDTRSARAQPLQPPGLSATLAARPPRARPPPGITTQASPCGGSGPPPLAAPPGVAPTQASPHASTGAPRSGLPRGSATSCAGPLRGHTQPPAIPYPFPQGRTCPLPNPLPFLALYLSQALSLHPPVPTHDLTRGPRAVKGSPGGFPVRTARARESPRRPLTGLASSQRPSQGEHSVGRRSARHRAKRNVEREAMTCEASP